ncbi:glycosyltransferase [Egbenema bharatensis]|uniref:glycosyltransferase n=1 Tax=Egbenema bharatensis TaxID=3463334 RepID=UPI003A87E93B
MARERNLTILSSEAVTILPNGQFSMTQKTLEGILQYGRFWSNPITLMMERKRTPDDYIGQIQVTRDDLPFKLEVVDFATIQDGHAFDPNAVVLASAVHQQNHISQVCRAANIPCIYLVEYSLRTRKQIVATNTKNPLIRLRRNLWQDSQERKQRRSIALANGLQCNGTPTYENYRTINSNSLLFFDTRITEEMATTEDQVKRRYAQREPDRPLHLLFSGRLIKMKGADHLLQVAKQLKQLGIAFKLSICGEGDLTPMMQRQIADQGLSDCVQMLGVLDFKTELVPFIKENIDLFVCCHRQGDPSCTYLETMACGVPIIGYDNEAFQGVVDYSKAGWLVPMNHHKQLANKVAELSTSLDELKDASLKALSFARQNTFEKTFNRRVAHIHSVIEQAEQVVPIQPTGIPALS